MGAIPHDVLVLQQHLTLKGVVFLFFCNSRRGVFFLWIVFIVLQQQGESDMRLNFGSETDTVADICWTSDVRIK